jgi:hypothetical protein
MWILSASVVERLSDSNRVQSHGGISSATAVLSLDQSLVDVAGTQNDPALLQAYCRFGQEGLNDPRHVGLTCFTRASNQLAPAVTSVCTYITQGGAVEPENIVKDIATSFSRSRAAVPFISSSART